MKPILSLLKPFIPTQFRHKLRALYERIYWFGFRYRCPFCESHLRSLLPIGLTFPVLKEAHVVGGGYRESARCPICRSSDRERLLYLYLRQKTDVFTKSSKVLHVAPEPRLEPILRATSQSNYLTADISGRNVMTKMDITDVSVPDNTFDVILCNHVLEHVGDDRKAMSGVCLRCS
jgi:hypothetical protein